MLLMRTMGVSPILFRMLGRMAGATVLRGEGGKKKKRRINLSKTINRSATSGCADRLDGNHFFIRLRLSFIAITSVR